MTQPYKYMRIMARRRYRQLSWAGRFGLMMALIAMVSLPLAPSFASKENWALPEDLVTSAADLQRQDPLLVLTVGKAEIVDISGAVSDIMVADPDIVDVVALQANRMYMVGAKVGNTNVMALDADGNILKRLNIHVRVDERTLEETLGDLFPNEKIRARTVNDQVILVGQVSNPATAAQVRDLAIRFVGDEKNLINLVKVSGDMQVMLKVRVLEVSRAILKELGVESTANDPAATNLGGGLSGLLSVNDQTGLTADPFGVGRLIYDTGIDGIGFTEILVNALEEDKLINILAEPNLTAISGEEAAFLAGGEFPIPVGRDNQGRIQIEFKPFGVSLNFRPVVLNENRISLQLKTEVSSLDPEEGIVLDEITVPGLDVRRAETIVEINSGGSLMIAGMLKSETVKGLSGLPGARNVPILGKLISSDSFNREETELLIVVTPFVVEPMAQSHQARAVKRTDMDEKPLANVFVNNLRSVYGKSLPNLPDLRDQVGYIID